MPYSIIGIKSHATMATIAQVGKHNERERETPNADPERQQENERLLGSGDLCADVQARLDQAGITTVRSNGIRAVEHMLTASPEWFREAGPEGVRAWVDRSVEWLKDRYGDNLVSAHLHMDETSPQIHAVMVPITPEGRLSKTYYFDRPQQLRDMHTSYNQAVSDLGLERGTERSKAEHRDIQEWYHTMGYPTREAWELARHITIAPPEKGGTIEERVAAAIAPILAGERTRAKYWKDQAEQTGRQLDGARERLREGKSVSYERYGEIAKRVRDTDLTDVLMGLGGQRDRTDKNKWHINGHELNVRGQKYYDFQAPEGADLARRGGAIDLTRYVTGWDFKTTVDYLNQRHYGGHAFDAPVREQAAYVQPAPDGPTALPQVHADRWPEARRYLVDQRSIPGDLVDQAYARGDVYATAHGRYTNVVFVRRDENGQAIGAAIRGTHGPYHESTRRGGYFGLEFGAPNDADKPTLTIVESPIDALSYAALHRRGLRYGRVISTDGQGPLPTAEINLILAAGGMVRAAFDNDGPQGGGEKLWARLQERYPEQTSGQYTPIMRQIPKAKDWNEDLQRSTSKERHMEGPSRGPSMGR